MELWIWIISLYIDLVVIGMCFILLAVTGDLFWFLPCLLCGTFFVCVLWVNDHVIRDDK